MSIAFGIEGSLVSLAAELGVGIARRTWSYFVSPSLRNDSMSEVFGRQGLPQPRGVDGYLFFGIFIRLSTNSQQQFQDGASLPQNRVQLDNQREQRHEDNSSAHNSSRLARDAIPPSTPNPCSLVVQNDASPISVETVQDDPSGQVRDGSSSNSSSLCLSDELGRNLHVESFVVRREPTSIEEFPAVILPLTQHLPEEADRLQTLQEPTDNSTIHSDSQLPNLSALTLSNSDNSNNGSDDEPSPQLLPGNEETLKDMIRRKKKLPYLINRTTVDKDFLKLLLDKKIISSDESKMLHEQLEQVPYALTWGGMVLKVLKVLNNKKISTVVPALNEILTQTKQEHVAKELCS